MDSDHQTTNLTKIAKLLNKKLKLPDTATASFYDSVRDLLEAYCLRMRDALTLYRPIAREAKRFHKSGARIRLIAGSNQCLAGTQKIHDPVTGQTVPVSEISSSFHVASLNPATGVVEVKEACEPFIKGRGELVRVTLSNDRTLDCTMAHRLIAEDGTWVSVSAAWINRIPLLHAWYLDLADGLTVKQPTDSSGHPIRFRVPRDHETATVTDVTPLGQGPIWDLTVADHANYAAGGVFNRNSGKTTAAVVEVMRIWRGMDPYAKRAAKNLKLMVVGKDLDHVGQVIFSKMYWPGLFHVIRDKKTGLYRAVRCKYGDMTQLDPEDEARQDEWMPSPPLLPPTEVKSLSWEKRNQGIPKRVELHNGSIALFHSSKAAPRQGIEVDLFYCDEEMENRAWLNEGRARLLRRDGLMIASFTPQASTPEYFDLHVRAQRGEPDIAEFSLQLDDNPYISKHAKKALFDDLKDDPDELAVRYYGQYAIQGRRVYPEYNTDRHGVPAFDVPADWMRIVCVDPGAQYQTALFAAVPPDASQIHFYDEIHAMNANAFMLAKMVKEKLGRAIPEVFLIDYRGGKQRPMGYSNTVADHYEEEFLKMGLNSRISANTFIYASDDVAGREQSLKRWLRSDDRSEPLLRFHLGRTGKLDHQLRGRYYSKKDATKRDNRAPHDVADCAEYIAAFFDQCVGTTETGLYYEPPERQSPRLDPHYQAYLKMERYYAKLENRNRTSISLG